MSASSSNCAATSAFRGRASAMRAMIGAMPRVTVCLPTYNERENLERMLRALREVLPAEGGVLVIDDGSPDGTGELADRLSGEIANVAVLHRGRKEQTSCWRWTATSRTIRTMCHDCSRPQTTPTSSSAHGTSRAAACATG